MPYPSVFFIHACTVTQRRATGQDDAGGIVYQETPLPARACRFSSAGAAADASGLIYAAKCAMAPTNDVEQNDIIESSNQGFNRRYWVNSVQQVYEAVGGVISHTVLELRETEYQERAP